MEALLEYRSNTGQSLNQALGDSKDRNPHEASEASAHYTRNLVREKDVLIVDDITMTAGLTQVMLSHHGISSAVVYAGEDALGWLEHNRTGVVLCDISMPGMDGLALAKHIDARWGDERPRLIAYTAYPRDHERVALIEAGFDDFIAKPVRADTLATVIRKWLD